MATRIVIFGRGGRVLALAALPFVVALPVKAGPAENLQPFMACQAIADSVRRLACYDAAAAALAAREAVDRSPEAAKKSKEESFGKEQLSRDRQGDEKEAEKYRAKVAVFSRDGYGNLILVLENGQVWRQTDGAESPILNGEQWVTLHRAAMGSYLVTLESTHRAYRFKRVK